MKNLEDNEGELAERSVAARLAGTRGGGILSRRACASDGAKSLAAAAFVVRVARDCAAVGQRAIVRSILAGAQSSSSTGAATGGPVGLTNPPMFLESPN
jgi:hypothetical protein